MPRAVASGAAGPSEIAGRVRPARVALVVGALTIAYVGALYGTRELPGFALRLVGHAPDGVARYGGVVGTGPDGELVEIPRITEAEAPELIARLKPGGELRFGEVVETRTELAALATLGLVDSSPGSSREPSLEVDRWRSEDGLHTSTYLRATNRAQLEDTFREATRRGWAPPANTQIFYERMEPSERTGQLFYRSFFVELSDLLPSDLADAIGVLDVYTNGPSVILHFTPEGARKFGDLTTRIVGHKMAIVLGGEIQSAPIINGPIRGGHAQITMRGSDPVAMEHERDVTVAMLLAGAQHSPAMTNAHFVASSGGANPLGARGLLALLAGLAMAALAFAVVRFARPEREVLPEVSGSTTPGLGRKVAWTAFAILVLLVGSCWPLPGLDTIELEHVLGRGSPHTHFDATLFSIFALGLTPLLASFITIEVVASIVPRWRKLRDGIAGRRRLGLATAILAILVACAQAYFMTKHLGDLDRDGSNMFDPHMFWSCAAALAGGPIVLAVLASIITSRGLGNGYVVLVVAAWLWSVPWTRLVDPVVVSHAELVLAVITIAIAGTFGIALVSWRVRAAGRVNITPPVGGLAPLYGGGGLLVVVSTLAHVGVKLPFLTTKTSAIFRTSPIVALFACVVATALWGFVFARPGRRRATLAVVQLEATSGEQWGRAIVLSGVALAGLLAIDLVLPRPFHVVGDPAFVMIAAVTLVDLRAEWRARRRANLVPVWPLQDPLLVDAARERLAASEIPAFIQASRFRALSALFASYAPMMVFVPAEHATRAHTLLREWLEPT
jgi:hypothetical protein